MSHRKTPLTLHPHHVSGKIHHGLHSFFIYYHDIKYIEELGLLFRPYKKSPDSEADGLQIYRGQTLIADVAVPKGMVVLGYSEPYVYGTTSMDGIRESVDMFRFKLE